MDHLSPSPHAHDTHEDVKYRLTNEYYQDKGAKIDQINKMADKAFKNLEEQLKTNYQEQWIEDGDETNDDQKFLEEAKKEVEVLRGKAIREILDNKTETTLFYGVEGSEVSALFHLATVRDLDPILDTSNGFITGLEDGGSFDISDKTERANALDYIVFQGIHGNDNFDEVMKVS